MGEDSYWNGTNWQLPDYSKNTLFSQKSLEFDGVDDYVDISNVFELGVTSISFWMKSTDISAGGITTGLCNLSFLYTTPLLRLASQNYRYFADQVAKFDGNWHHWFVLIAGSGTLDIANARMFVDGVELVAGTTIHYGAPSAWTASQIGTGMWGGKAALIDEFAIWQSDQTANVSTIWNNGVPNDLTSLSPLGWWRMGEDATWDSGASEWTIPDASTNSNDGTSSGMDEVDLEFNSPTNPNAGLSDGMDIEDKVNNAPDNINQGLSSGMDEADRETDVP